MNPLDSGGHRHVAKRQDRSVPLALSLLETMARHACVQSQGVIDMDELLSAGHLAITQALANHDPHLAPLRAHLGLRIRWALASECRALRRRRRERHLPLTGKEPLDPETEMSVQQRQRRLHAALAELPAEEQRLVMDHYFHDKSLRQLASERRMSHSTAWRRHRTAMRRLRRQLADLAEP